MINDKSFLQQAFDLAKIRRGFCAPNPSVGAVLVKDNQIIAQGYHLGSGHPHAEVEALRNIGEEAKDATLYVTLEPCCHTNKKTPPCTELLIQKKLKQVIYGFRDPNPQVAGLGEKILRTAGIDCQQIPLPEIEQFYASYQYWWQHKKPWVTAKLALSLDGKIAGFNGQRIAITSEIAQQFTHQQRKQSNAILTTAKTIICDDPLLNVRLNNEQYIKPIYILDSELITPINAKIFSTDAPLTFFHQSNISQEKIDLFLKNNTRCIPVNHDQKGLNLLEVLNFIGRDGKHDLWIEAGGKCFQAFAQQLLLQTAFIYVAPKWLGENAQPAFTDSNTIFNNVKNYEWFSLGQDSACKMSW